MRNSLGHRWIFAGVSGLMLTLAGCAEGPTPYQPALADGSDGYIVTQIEMNRFRLAFNGNEATPHQTVDIDMLYLAAQVTLKNGGDWFDLGKYSSDKTTSFPTYPTGPGGFGPWGGGYFGGGWGGFDGGLQTDFSMPQNSWQEAADIVIHRGAKPANDPSAYDAHDVAVHLAPAVRWRGRPGIY